MEHCASAESGCNRAYMAVPLPCMLPTNGVTFSSIRSKLFPVVGNQSGKIAGYQADLIFNL